MYLVPPAKREVEQITRTERDGRGGQRGWARHAQVVEHGLVHHAAPLARKDARVRIALASLAQPFATLTGRTVRRAREHKGLAADDLREDIVEVVEVHA